MKTFIVRDSSILERAIAFARANWQAMAGTKHPLQIDFKPETKKRSLEANRYYWNIMHQIETEAWVEGRQYGSETWHELAKRKFIGCIDMPGGGLMAMSTTNLSTAEFAAYVEKVEVWAATELGVSFVEDIEPQGRP